MNDWIADYAAALDQRLNDADQPLAPSDEAATLVLDLARIVAHGTERRNAPVAAYLAGTFAGLRQAAGMGTAEALREAIEVAEALA